MRPHRCVVVSLLALAVGPGNSDRSRGGQAAPPARAQALPGQYALLVGVTRYPNLEERYWLEGPANDVHLMAELLRDYFRFPPENITTLSEEAGAKDPQRLPTKGNIRRECERLAGLAREGEKVVVFLSGHGSLQPEDPKFPEPDGLSRTFLPRDVGKWDGGSATVPNAIPGRELSDWLRPIPRGKALLWLIADCCHSGEMARDPAEKARQLEPERGLGIPGRDLTAASDRARSRRPAGSAVKADRVPLLRQEEGVAIIYACQSREVTVERPMPPGVSDPKPYGLMTYTLNRVLRPAIGKMTCRELVQRINREYLADGRHAPVPLSEGTAQDRVVLGLEEPRRSRILVSAKDDALLVNVGRLHGLTPGSVLAVKDLGGKLLGHVRVTRKIKTTEAEVEPCAYEQSPPPKREALVGGVAEVVKVDFGDLRLKAAVDTVDSHGKPVPPKVRDRLRAALDRASRAGDSPVVVTDSVGQADWLLRADSGNVHLLRRSEWVAAKPNPLVLGPVGGDDLLDRLREGLGRVVRAAQLLKLAADLGGADDESDFGPHIKVTLRHRAPGGGWQQAEGPVATVTGGETVQLELSNPGRVSVDVTVLYVNSDFGIDVFFPGTEEINRLSPRAAPVKMPPFDVNTTSTGREHFVVIAVKGEGPPMDFSGFMQPSLQRAKKENERAVGGNESKRGFESPLGRLLRNAMYQDADTTSERGMSRAQLGNYQLQVLPVQVEAGPRDR
jgi:hypothetical protein